MWCEVPLPRIMLKNAGVSRVPLVNFICTHCLQLSAPSACYCMLQGLILPIFHGY